MNCQIPVFCDANVKTIPISGTTILIFEIIMILLFIGIILYLFKIKHKKTLRNLLITLIGVILFELMIEPMVINTGFSSWTYYYNDMSFVITLGWVLIVGISISLIDFTFPKLSEFKKFWLYLCTIDAIALPIEILLVQTGMRFYSQSLIASSYGANIPFTILPLEVAFAIPMFFALVIGFTKYWEKMLNAK
tara:strand:+ start:26186 stop:26761 length:576 start_codon:yes stop_codon:yes gene_type:complete